MYSLHRRYYHVNMTNSLTKEHALYSKTVKTTREKRQSKKSNRSAARRVVFRFEIGLVVRHKAILPIYCNENKFLTSL